MIAARITAAVPADGPGRPAPSGSGAGTPPRLPSAPMGGAALWSFVGASTLVIGALVGIRFEVPLRAVGLVMAFGAGTLISAVAFDLTLVAYHEAGQGPTLFGMVVGAMAFWAGDRMLEARSGEDPVVEAEQVPAAEGPAAEVEASVSGPSLVLGALLDGVPESVAISTTLLGGSPVSVAMVTAVFISNVPEGLAASVGLRHAGMSSARILGIWAAVVAASVGAAVAGYALLGNANPDTIAVIQAFAAGAILTMLANTMMPQALTHGGKEAGLLTVLGFIVAAGLAIRG
jgi:ZIP family zinc transporter